jgi:DNA mismatch repair ATPase MutS
MKEYYFSRIDSITENIKQLEHKDNIFSVARLVSFVLLVTGIIFSTSTLNSIFIILSLIMIFVFTRIIIMHLTNLNLLKTQKDRKEMLQNEIDCVDHEGNRYYNGSYFADSSHDYTPDMDVFGTKSLFHYINRCATGVGNRALALWLGNQYPETEILNRQKSVQELAGNKEWCEEIRVNVYGRKIKDFDKEHLPALQKTSAFPASTKNMIIISWTLLALSVGVAIFTPAGISVLLLPVAFNIFFNHRVATVIRNIRVQLEGRERTLNDYLVILNQFERKEFQSTFLNELKQKLRHHDMSAMQAISRLQSLSKMLDYSLNMIVGAILNLLFIWDILICFKISGWFDEYAEKSGVWFDAAGQLEALISLSTLHNNHPEWVYPEFTGNDDFHFSAKSLGHPLIPPQERITNDYSLMKPALLNIVTGSNMAGKSTFLRTVGVNVILAKAGAPVCAEKLALSHFRIMTYLTITDSLVENTSTFYREIKRLKKILDSAREDNNILLLLDELLRGTNSADKAKGSIAIARELILYKVPAIIATHNLELADLKFKHLHETENYFFDIVIENNLMRFDYKLKPGVCNTFNASLLLKEIGISIID